MGSSSATRAKGEQWELEGGDGRRRAGEEESHKKGPHTDECSKKNRKNKTTFKHHHSPKY